MTQRLDKDLQFLVENDLSQDTIDQIVSIARDYTADYFTMNVPDATREDLKLQRVALLKTGEEIVSFIIFTSLDGCPQMTLFATKRKYAGRGYGTMLMKHFAAYLNDLGFRCVELMTVLPESKPIYFRTVKFYESMGFEITERHPDLWESGAIKLKLVW